MLGIRDQIDDDLLELLTEAKHRLRTLIHAGAHFDVVGAQHALPNLRDVTHQLIQLDAYRRAVSPSRETQQAADNAGRAIHFAHDRGRGGARLGVLSRPAQELRLHPDRGQRVVHFVRYAARDFADGGEFLARDELALCPQLVGPVIQRHE